MWRWLIRSASLAVAVGLFAAPAVQASDSGGESALAAVRNATASFHDLGLAKAVGYAPLLACFDSPGVGGMGQHYVNGSFMDGRVVAEQPQALVYEVDPDGLQLVAVEYIVPKPIWSAPTPPSLYGQTFHSVDALNLWALHAWIWRPNPLGIFADYNPNVRLCPGH